MSQPGRASHGTDCPGWWRAAELLSGLIALACLVASAQTWFHLIAPRPPAAPLPAAVWSVAPPGPVDSGADDSSDRPAPPTGSTAAPGPAPVAADGSELGPSELVIPSLGLRAPIGSATVADGRFQVPADPARTARWVDGGQLDGTTGTVLIAGHVAFQGRPGALNQLASIEPGRPIWTTDQSGRASLWLATELYTSPAGDPLPELYDASGPRRLALVTCGGRLSDGQYSVNVVVIARPAPV